MAGKADVMKDNILTKLTSIFFVKWKITLVLWLFIVGLGTATYTSIIQREGFPPIQFPLSFVGGAYPGQSVEQVDQDILKPLSDALESKSEISSVDANAASDSSFTAVVFFNEGVTSREGTELVKLAISDEVDIPQGAIINAVAIDPGAYLFEYDLVAHVYSTGGASTETLDAAAAKLAGELSSESQVESAAALSSISSLPNGQMAKTSFTRIGQSENGEVPFYSATAIGVKQAADTDTIELSDVVNEVVASVDLSEFDGDVQAIVSADFANDIRNQIDFLESNLLTSLLAVAFVSLILITWRASIITSLFMITVMLATILVLWLIGYTLNVITLFALILSLGLFVDDATIVVEAVDVSKKKRRLGKLDVARSAVSKVGTASLAGTLTTVLVFAILASPSGILGQFIRLIPITVMIALALSFLLSITLIPFLAKYIMLDHREQSWLTRVNPILKFEIWLSEWAEKLVLKVKKRSGKFMAAGAVLISLVLFMSGAFLFMFKVDNNTFPPSKDTDQLGIQVKFNGLRSVDQAEATSEQLDRIISDTIGDNVVYGYYGIERLADAQQATIILNLVPFTDRDIKAPQLAENLTAAIEDRFTGPALVTVDPVDNGPPSSQFPFGIRVYSEDLEVLTRVTSDISSEFEGAVLENFNGEKIAVLGDQIGGIDKEILRDNGRRYAITRFTYDSENPTLVALLTEQEFKDRYDDARLEALGVEMDLIEFDAGQEGDFQDSFNTLLLAIPIALLLMYGLLAIQFRSFAQPFLILLAVPFTLFGVALGLFLTDNAASFFALVGFIGLTGIAVNNTIMLTDYANQERRAGAKSIDAIASATKKRLRPLIATTLTTVVALLPLALNDPFWEALAVTIIFGLVSSTLLVLISFPYYYLATEKLREWFRTNRIFRIIVLVIDALLVLMIANGVYRILAG